MLGGLGEGSGCWDGAGLGVDVLGLLRHRSGVKLHPLVPVGRIIGWGRQRHIVACRGEPRAAHGAGGEGKVAGQHGVFHARRVELGGGWRRAGCRRALGRELIVVKDAVRADLKEGSM